MDQAGLGLSHEQVGREMDPELGRPDDDDSDVRSTRPLDLLRHGAVHVAAEGVDAAQRAGVVPCAADDHETTPQMDRR